MMDRISEQWSRVEDEINPLARDTEELQNIVSEIGNVRELLKKMCRASVTRTTLKNAVREALIPVIREHRDELFPELVELRRRLELAGEDDSVLDAYRGASPLASPEELAELRAAHESKSRENEVAAALFQERLAAFEARVAELDSQFSESVASLRTDVDGLSSTDAEQGERIEEHAQRLRVHDEALEGHGGRLEGLEASHSGRLEGLEASHAGLLEGLEASRTEVREALEAHSGQLEAHSGQLEAHSGQLEAHAGQLETHSGRLETHSGQLETHSGQLEAHSGRLEEQHGHLDQQGAKLEEQAGALADLGTRLDGESARIGENEVRIGELSELAARQAAQVGELEGAVEEKVQAVRETLGQLEASMPEVARQAADEVEARLRKEIAAMVTELSGRLEELQATLGRLGETLPTREMVAGVEERLGRLEDTFRKVAGQVDQASPEILALAERFSSVHQDIANVASQLRATDSGVDEVRAALVARLEALSGELRGLNDRWDSDQASLNERLSSVRDSLRDQLRAFTDHVQSTESSLWGKITGKKEPGLKLSAEEFEALSAKLEGVIGGLEKVISRRTKG